MDAALRLPPDSRLLAFPSPSPRLPLDRLSPNCLLARGAFHVDLLALESHEPSRAMALCAAQQLHQTTEERCAP